MKLEISQSFKFAITMLSIINPLGAIPVFLGFTKAKKNLNIKRVTSTTAFSTTMTLLVSFIIGQFLLDFFGISIASFKIAGGLLLFTMAFSMISAHQSNTKMNDDELNSLDFEREISIIPLAIPLLSGPGAISTVIIYAKSATSFIQHVGAIIVILLIGVLIKLILSYADKIGDRLGQIGLNVLTRIMGLILLSMSIEMIAYGLKDILPVLKLTF